MEKNANVASAEPEEEVQTLADEMAAASPSVQAPEENMAAVQDAALESDQQMVTAQEEVLIQRPMPEIMEEDAKALPEVMAEEPNTEAAAEPAAPQLVDDISEIPQELVQEQPAEPILDVPQSAEESVEIVPADPEDRVTSARSSVQIAPEALAPPVEEVAATWPDAEEKEGSIVEPERVEDTVTAPPIEPPQEQ
eukprot:4859599-Amphidinium_carterae.1